MTVYKSIGLLSAARVAAEEKASRREEAAYTLVNWGDADLSHFSEWEERGILASAALQERQGREDDAYNAAVESFARGGDETAAREAIEESGVNPKRVGFILGAVLAGRPLRGNKRRPPALPVSSIPKPTPVGKGVVKRAPR